MPIRSLTDRIFIIFIFIRPGEPIMGAMLWRAGFNEDIDYATFVLKYCMAEGIDGGDKMATTAARKNAHWYQRKKSNELSDIDSKRYHQFFQTYTKWLAHFEIPWHKSPVAPQ